MSVSIPPLPDWLQAAILHDPLDVWGKITAVGLNELAAVFSFAKRYDRRGQVFLLDDFNHGLSGWTLESTGVDAETVLSSENPMEGGFCLHLVTGDAVGNYAQATKEVPFPPEGKHGVGLSFTWEGYDGYFGVTFTASTGEDRYFAGVRYDSLTQTLKYLDEDGNYTVFEIGLVVDSSGVGYNHLKMVVDLDTVKYVRCLLNEVEYDMSALSMRVVTGVYYRNLELAIKVEALEADNVSARVDGFVGTFKEPA